MPTSSPTPACWYPVYTSSQSTGYCLNNLDPVNGINCYDSKRECCITQFGHGWAPNANFCLSRDESAVVARVRSEDADAGRGSAPRIRGYAEREEGLHHELERIKGA